MPSAATYSAVERLRDGRRVEIRALRPSDRSEMLAAVDRMGTESLRRRFFGLKRSFSEAEIASFFDLDFRDRVALVAIVEEDERSIIAGGARYIVVDPGKAEVAFAVVDAYQGRGIGALLMRHLARIARDSEVYELFGEVLRDNIAMLKVFKNSGFPVHLQHTPSVVHVAVRLC
jgi:GNAT superfamily N-acetyltransferase